MRLWQLPGRALPVTLRPLGGETVISYTRRLAEVNGLAPTAIMRALGQVIPGSGYHLLDHDAARCRPHCLRRCDAGRGRRQQARGQRDDVPRRPVAEPQLRHPPSAR